MSINGHSLHLFVHFDFQIDINAGQNLHKDFDYRIMLFCGVTKNI